DVLDRLGQPPFLPALAAVARAEDLALARDAVDLVRIAGMEGQRHHRALGLDAVIDAPPALSEIVALVERAVLTARRRAQRGDQGAGVVRRDLHVTRVGQRREAADLHVL